MRYQSLFLCLSFVSCSELLVWPSSNLAGQEPSQESNGGFSISGRILERGNRKPFEGASVALYSCRGIQYESILHLQDTRTDANGHFRFDGLEPPLGNRFTRLKYILQLSADGCPTTVFPVERLSQGAMRNFSLQKGIATYSGKVVDENGRPVSGATVMPYNSLQTDELGLPSFTTQKNGFFVLPRMPKLGSGKDHREKTLLLVRHRDYPVTWQNCGDSDNVQIVLKSGCRVEGQILNEKTREPMQDLLVGLIPFESNPVASKAFATTDQNGNYVVHVSEGKYKVVLESDDWVAKGAVITCRKDSNVRPEPLLAQPGGWIVGQVIDTSNNQPRIHNIVRQGPPDRIALGVYGPSRPRGRLIQQHDLAEVDSEGRFRIRAYPGENYPYFQNIHGSRTAFNTMKMPPVIVRAGQETKVELTYTPPQTSDEKMDAAQKVLANLPNGIPMRVEAILAEFRRLNGTVDECEVWCLLMKELTVIGSDAVPTLCQELDRTEEQLMMRRLGFALRAIGDPRAVPSLIRALPKTLIPPSSDYGLIVDDAELTLFMHQHQIKPKKGGRGHFGFGRPVREIYAALVRLTQRGDSVNTPLSSMTLRKDLRAQTHQRKTYHQEAQRWANWWEENWHTLGVDETHSKVQLAPYVPADTSHLPTGLTLTNEAEKDRSSSGHVLSPIGDPDENANFFLDLDLGGRTSWPDDLPPRDSEPSTIEAAKKWAASKGFDLTCEFQTNADDEIEFCLTGIDLQIWEIDPFDARNLNEFLKEGKLPEGRKVEGGRLLHLDPKTGERRSTKQSSFLYLTRDHGLGVITITDMVTQAKDITGQLFVEPGTGFHRGVRFDYTTVAR